MREVDATPYTQQRTVAQGRRQRNPCAASRARFNSAGSPKCLNLKGKAEGGLAASLRFEVGVTTLELDVRFNVAAAYGGLHAYLNPRR